MGWTYEVASHRTSLAATFGSCCASSAPRFSPESGQGCQNSGGPGKAGPGHMEPGLQLWAPRLLPRGFLALVVPPPAPSSFQSSLSLSHLVLLSQPPFLPKADSSQLLCSDLVSPGSPHVIWALPATQLSPPLHRPVMYACICSFTTALPVGHPGPLKYFLQLFHVTVSVLPPSFLFFKLRYH